VVALLDVSGRAPIVGFISAYLLAVRLGVPHKALLDVLEEISPVLAVRILISCERRQVVAFSR
jgi:hypothetical protein